MAGIISGTFTWLALAAQTATFDADAFRAELIVRLQTQHPSMTFEPGAEELVVTYDKGRDNEGSINLHRVFGFCQSAEPRDCEQEKLNLVSKVLVNVPQVTKESLRIVVRDQQYVDYLEGIGRGSAKGRLAHYRRVGEDLYALIAADAPETIAMVGDKHLEELGISIEEAWAAAERNMENILPPLPEPEMFEGQAFAFQDLSYLSALVSDLSHWKRVSDAVGQDLFMTVVSEHFVFVGIMPDSSVAEFKSTVAEDCAVQPRCVSPNVYRFRDGRWRIAR